MRIITRVLRFMTYAYLLRFPVLTAAALIGIVVASFTFGSTLLGNLFDIYWTGGIFFLSLTAFDTAWVIMLTWRLVLLHGDRRFHLSSYAEPFKVKPNVSLKDVALYGAVALPIVCGAIYYSISRNSFGAYDTVLVLFEAALGLIVALIFLGAAAVIQKLLARPQHAHKRPSDRAMGAPDVAQTSPDIFLPSGIALLRPILKRVGDRDPAPRFSEGVLRLAQRVPESIGRGYFEYREGKAVSILPGHGMATAMFILTFLFYVAVGVYKYVRLDRPPYFPTLGYALLLLMLLCWGLSGLAFFLDRFRIPVLIPLLAMLFITSQFPWSDHFYPVIDLPAQAGQAVYAPPSHAYGRKDMMIVVAASGGGIQAAAWTARVLTGLEEVFGEDFARSIRVVSAVSGGSVGAMYFINEYTSAGPPPLTELEKIVERAEGSSLDKIAWGLIYPDLLRLYTSFGFGWDRGLALEDAFLRCELQWNNREIIKAGLYSWKRDAEAGWRPGLILNTTIADTGERLPLSTIDLPADSQGSMTQAEFRRQLGNKDIKVVTATRLSAAFPFVSPAARADVDGPGSHIVDGGYYDNYGVSSLVEWLDAELSKDGNEAKKVLFIQIHGAPTERKTELKTNRGWFYQAFAPVSTLLRVRSTGQLSHNQVELALLIDYWKSKVEIKPVVFEFSGENPPLSWHLNKKEKEAIEAEWKNEREGLKKQKDSDLSGVETIRAFLTE